MRGAFFEALVEVAAGDSRVMLLTGDLGFNAVESFASRFPRQFLNVGVAEQNLAGVAAGLAMTGRMVFTYSIGNFPTLRALEQIRNDICYHGANVKIVAVGGGYAYGSLGMSHHTTEDLAILRTLPGMVVLAPADRYETAEATRALASYAGPAYLRLGRTGERPVARGAAGFELGRAAQVREGRDLTIFSTGASLDLACETASLLASENMQARVFSMHTIKPLDAAAIHHAAQETRGLFTVEEHTTTGGLGGAVAEVLAELPGPRPVFRRFGLPDAYSPVAGSQQFLREQAGLVPTMIARDISQALRGARHLAIR